jgi:hypothetical protein
MTCILGTALFNVRAPARQRNVREKCQTARYVVTCTETSEVIMKEGEEDVLVFLVTLLYRDSVCWIHHVVPWWADYMYVERAMFKARVGCRTGVQPHN